MRSRGTTPRVELSSHPLWRLRLSASLIRWSVIAVAVAGLAASARFVVAPPRGARARIVAGAGPDLGAAAFAVDFARAYLTWSGADPGLHSRALAPYLGAAADPDAGVRPAGGTNQRIAWAEVVADQLLTPAEHVYTVEAQIAHAGLLYLDVDVARRSGFHLVLVRYPALVGAPPRAAATSLDGPSEGEVLDSDLASVVARAVENYVDGSSQNLAADLAGGVAIETPGAHLAFDRVDALRMSYDGRVLATASAHDASGDTFTLSYRVGVTRAAGRWEVTAIETPTLR